ncbi:galc [Symbiodinium natans]|uniref:galactosylceramidase n=1 Tax=Symbiodinium natans TaxID=878477 RepID=A0A812IA44_9DINO|nr:galc [Symbiodinium natans]
MSRWRHVAILCLCQLCLQAAVELVVDRTHTSSTFDGVGGLSGGGATSVLLPDYAEPSRSQILDYLFTPNFGASLQLLKVEIGGDSQSTDGTESSHMHDSETVDLHTGYEWWLMQEAKKRNPDIKLYGLAWAFPGWVGEGSGDPFKFPERTAHYLTEWVSGAKSEYGLDIDYLGIWNERASDSSFVQVLRKTLNQAGYAGTKLVVKDGDMGICNDLLKDKAYADAVDIVGLHYPSDFADFSACNQLGKPIWASEESSSYDDMNGAACWGRVINSHWVINRMTSSIMWNLVGAYYHGTNWYASSMMTSVQPWSGHYEVNPVIWATAHVTQFTKIGWKYLANGSGSGELPHGGYYATWVDPSSQNFTMNFVKISRDHASCTRPPLPSFEVEEETLTVLLAPSLHAPPELQVWYSNFESYDDAEPPVFQHSTVQVRDSRFSIKVPIGGMLTVTTIKTGRKGTFLSRIPPSSPSFPLDYMDDFQTTEDSRNARWFADQIGSFEIHRAEDGKRSLRQMVPLLPIGWTDKGSRGPMTLIGMREWQDIKVQVSFRLPVATHGAAADAACVGARVDQMWKNGVVLCINRDGHWELLNSGPALQGSSAPAPVPIASGSTRAIGSTWHVLSLEVGPSNEAQGALDGRQLLSNVPVRDMDTGFAAIGANGWFPIEFRNFSVSKAPAGWSPPASCLMPRSPRPALSAQPCSRNGYMDPEQAFDLLPSYQLLHIATGLCASASEPGPVVLEKCDATQAAQLFVNDYTLVRNTLVDFDSKAVNKPLAGDKSGAVFVGKTGDWAKWTYFPNTKQLRNQYVAQVDLGYPMCLSSCPKKALVLEENLVYT